MGTQYSIPLVFHLLGPTWGKKTQRFFPGSAKEEPTKNSSGTKNKMAAMPCYVFLFLMLSFLPIRTIKQYQKNRPAEKNGKKINAARFFSGLRKKKSQLKRKTFGDENKNKKNSGGGAGGGGDDTHTTLLCLERDLRRRSCIDSALGGNMSTAW